MMKHEFEEIAGYEVTNEDYNNIIEPMYMALPDVTKQEFVKMIDKKRFALPTKKQVINDMKKIANHLYEICGRYSDYKAEHELDRISREFAKRFYGIDWANDTTTYVFTLNGYEFPEIQRGCRYPKTLVIGNKYGEIERIELVK